MLTLEEEIGQMMVVGFEGLEAPDYLLEWLAAGRVGGVILFRRNVGDPAQVAALTASLHAAARHPLLIAIDQEGGAVARLHGIAYTESPGAMALGAADSEDLAEQVATVLGREMRALGINWNLAPVLDLTHNIDNPSVGVRSLGVDPQRVCALGAAQVRGFQAAGVAATAKHFPGKADTPIDPHISLPVIEAALDEMWDVDMVPFQGASDAGIAAMMITHVQFRTLEPDYPSTMSPAVIQGLLREKIGFEGVISTDCMEMGAVTNTYGPGESAVLAALAGADAILFSHTRALQEAAYEAVLEAAQSGRLPLAIIDAANARLAAMKTRYAVTQPPAPEVIRRPEHLAVMLAAARAGTVLLKAAPGALPIRADDSRRVALIEFASYPDTVAVEQSDAEGLAEVLGALRPGVACVGLRPDDLFSGPVLERARTLAVEADLLVVATRSAHLVTPQADLARELLGSAREGVLVCLRNPYDAGVLAAATVLCTCGDSPPSLQAAAEALIGAYTPSARLPVPVVGGGGRPAGAQDCAAYP